MQRPDADQPARPAHIAEAPPPRGLTSHRRITLTQDPTSGRRTYFLVYRPLSR